MRINKKLLYGLVFALIACYITMLYITNTQSCLSLSPIVEIYEPNQNVQMRNGFYNLGYSELDEYEICLTSVTVGEAKDIMPLLYVQEQTDNINPISPGNPIILVDLTVKYESQKNPIGGVIDLSNFLIVGTDYYIHCSPYVVENAKLNEVLRGNHMFSLRDGIEVNIQLPFIVDIDSEWSLNMEYVTKSSPKLLISRYPYELYINIESFLLQHYE